LDDSVFKRAAEYIKGDPARHLVAYAFIAKNVPIKPVEIRDKLGLYIKHQASDLAIHLPAEPKAVRDAISKKISAIKTPSESIPFVEVVLRWWSDTEAYSHHVIDFFEALGFSDLGEGNTEPVGSALKILRRADDETAIINSSPQLPPFDFNSLIPSAVSGLTFVAQNHWILLGEGGTGEDYWPLIEAAMHNGVSVEIAAMGAGLDPIAMLEPERRAAVETWSLYLQATKFEEHLKHTWQTLRSWSKRATALVGKLPTCADFHIASVDFCPYSMTVVDRKSDDGIMIISPRTGEKNPPKRPEFALRKASDRTAFNSFIVHVDDIFLHEVNARTEYRLRPR
jgi:hypothetical protein